MIDWNGACIAALWIAGLAVLLATLSHARWLSGAQGLRLGAVLSTPDFSLACDLGLALFSLGLCLSARPLWQRVAWGLLAVLYAALALSETRKPRRAPLETPRAALAPLDPPQAAAAAGNQAGGACRLRVLQPWKRRLASILQRFELWWALAALPLLLLPGRHSALALAAIALWWALRSVAWGRTGLRTPHDAPVALLLCMLPVTLWASADVTMTLPALYQLIAGVALFYALANWATTPQRLATATTLWVLGGAGLAALGPLAATNWGTAKFFNALPVLTRVHAYVKPLWMEDINANVLGAGLAALWPLTAALLPAPLGASPWKATLARLGLAGASLAMAALLLLTQSRGALLALAGALAFMGLLRWPWLRWLGLLAAVALALWLWRAGAPSLQRWGEWLSSGGTLTSLAGRQEVWSRALYMTQDFPFSGIGLGTFDLVQPLLYPFFLSAGLVHHAHNLFLQVAVDLGLPGLIAYLALWLGCFHGTWQAYRALSAPRNPISETNPSSEHAPPWLSSLALGLLGSQTAMTLHGLLDTPVWSNKLAFLPWFAFGLSAALWKWVTTANGRANGLTDIANQEASVSPFRVR